MEGRPVFVDPGTYCYTGDPASRDQFRSARGHNSVLLDGRRVNPASHSPVFGPACDASGRTLEWKVKNGRVRVTGERDGYPSLPQSVTHRRTVEYLEATRAWQIEDSVEATGTRSLTAHWHFPPRTSAKTEAKANGLMIRLGSIQCDLEIQGVNRWHHEIVQGWVSPSYGVKEPAPVLRVALEFRNSLCLKTLVRSAEVSGADFQSDG